jgi:hypothetical protein
MRRNANHAGLWSARCGESRTPGAGGDSEKRTGRKASTALRVDLTVVSPVEPGGTRGEVLGSDGLPGSERLMGTRACQQTRGRAQALGTVPWGTRVIRRRLDCLKPNLPEMEVHIRRKRRLKPAPALRPRWNNAATLEARSDAQ